MSETRLWDLFLPTIREDAAQRKQARGIKEKHTAQEHEGIFISLDKAVRHHCERAKPQLEHNHRRFTPVKVLVNGANFSPHQPMHFRTLPAENHACGALFVQMVRAMVRKEKGRELRLDFSFTGAQRSSLEALMGSLGASAQGDAESTLLGAATAYQALCWPLASDLTPLLAKLKYFCRLTVLFEGVCCPDRPLNEDAAGCIGRLHGEVLRLGTQATFNMIWELQQFASFLAYGQVKDPDAFVDPGHAWTSIHGKTLRSERLRGGMQGLLREVKDSFMALSGYAAWPASPNGPILESLSNMRRGCCFLEEDPFRKRKNDFFLSAVQRRRLGTLSTEGAWIWSELAVRKFLDRADAVCGHFIRALYAGLQLSTRAAQFLQFQIRNADRPRNFLFQGKECMAVNRYGKTRNAKGKDGCIPAFLSNHLAEIFLALLGSGFREAQALLAGVVYGPEAHWCYLTYLCVKRGERIKPDHFYDWLEKRNQQRFGCGWGTGEFRQGMITLGHEFISPNETFPCPDGLLAESADHSTGVDASHCAVVRGALPRLSNSAASQRRWLSEEWSSLLRLGPRPPPEPVRAIRTRARSASSLDPNVLKSKLGAIGTAPDLLANLAQQQPTQAVPSRPRSSDGIASPVGPVPRSADWDAPPLDSPALSTGIQIICRSECRLHLGHPSRAYLRYACLVAARDRFAR
ncbi:hypothetical protein EV363DRAFT_1454502 [Boletus edulis]|nr:hypothetical protein EV363DRAFT_1454502 [Boletus edulis]